jgi:hypothetical protein
LDGIVGIGERPRQAKRTKTDGATVIKYGHPLLGIDWTEREVWVQRRMDGEPYADIRAAGGPLRLTLKRWAAHLNYDLTKARKRPRRAPLPNNALAESVVADYRDLKPLKSISIKNDVSIPTVYKLLRFKGVPLRHIHGHD